MKLDDSRRDQFRKLAKYQGYRSRSAFKLKQINQTHHILKKGNIVVDVGCAPGGWIQVAYEEVGEKGKVIGIDLKKMESIYGTILIHGNIEDEKVIAELNQLLDKKVDVILSDIAPNVSGNWELDHARQISLTESVFDLAKKMLKRNGTAVFKVFQGDMLNDLILRLKVSFERVIITKPIASRQESSELYLVCINFR